MVPAANHTTGELQLARGVVGIAVTHASDRDLLHRAHQLWKLTQVASGPAN